MRTIKKRLLAILLSLSMVFALLPALSHCLTVYADDAAVSDTSFTATANGNQQEVSADLEDIYAATQEKVFSIVTGDGKAFDKQWFAMDLARDNIFNENLGIIPYADGSFIEEYVNEIIDKNGVLHTGASDYTNYAKAILTLTSIGIDASNVDGINLVEKLADKTSVTKQGLNGVIYALLALDCAPYDPEGSDELRDYFVTTILNTQLADVGWDWANKKADPDMTAMALQALAPYYNSNASVKIAVDKAIVTLSCYLQQPDGGFQTEDAAYAESSESTSMVILALLALGIDPATDERFVKEGGSALENLCSFAVAGGGFKHTADGGYNGLATDQAYRALVGYFRMLAGYNTVYNMSDANGDMDLAPVEGHLHEEVKTFSVTDTYTISQVSAKISKDPTVAAMNGTVLCLVEADVYLFDEEGNFIDLVTVTRNEKEVELKVPADKLSQMGDKILIAGLHNNKEVITIEPTSVDRKTGVVKFKTSLFSYYAVVSGAKNANPEVPVTGDNAITILWIALMGAAVLAILSVMVIVRRKKSNR